MKPTIFDQLIESWKPFLRSFRIHGWIALALVVVLVMLIPMNLVSAGTPYTTILSVVTDQSVTLQTHNFPAHQTFVVTMGIMGTRGIGGTVVATTDSGAGGSFVATYNIPDNLKGLNRIAIRLESAQGYYAYDWFYNNTSSSAWEAWASAPSDSGSTSYYYGSYYYVTPYYATGYTGFPTITVSSAVKDTTVTLSATNMPPNENYTVRIGPFGTRASGGTVVGSSNTGSGGSMNLVYNIPVALKGSAMLDIRIDFASGKYAWDHWFYNTTGSNVAPTATSSVSKTATPTAGSSSSSTSATSTPTPTLISTGVVTYYYPYPSSGYNYTYGNNGYPYTNVVSVIQDTSVTLTAYDFPANQTFTATMGPMYTRGVNGTAVGSVHSGSGGSFTVTFNIPANLKGRDRISIRLQSPQGYFAYDWFYNSTGSDVYKPGNYYYVAPTATPGGTKTATPSGSKTPTPSVSRTPTPTTVHYTGNPYTTINSVVKDTSVTLTTHNFPAHQTFTVTMGKMHTQGINGVVVGTTDSGNGGSFTVTYNIPSSLKGEDQISIRLESPQGYYAYDWFNND